MTERERSKIGPGLVLTVALVPVGFLAGGVWALLTPGDAGLVSAVAAAFKVLTGGVVAVIIGIVLALLLPYPPLRRVQKAGLVLGLLATAFITYRILAVQNADASMAERAAAEKAERRAPQPTATPPDSL